MTGGRNRYIKDRQMVSGEHGIGEGEVYEGVR